MSKHVALEEAASGEDSLMPCTTTKPMAVVEEAATGEVAPHPLKRKSAAREREEALDMFPARDTIPHWAGSLSSHLSEAFPEDAELRRRVKQTLLTFPESGALSAKELEEAIERIARESKPETASVAAPGMVRLQDDDIRIWLFLLKTPSVDDILGADAGGVFPPRWIEERKMFLDEKCQVKNKKPDEDLFLVHKVRIDLITKGYVEVQKEYVQSDSDDDEGDACPYDTYGPDDEVQGGLVLLI